MIWDGGREDWEERDRARAHARAGARARPTWRQRCLAAGRTESFVVGLLMAGVVGAFGYAAVTSAEMRDGATAAAVCTPGYARAHRLAPEQYYPIAQEAYRRAGIPWAERSFYRLDHIVPLELGGSWDQSNLQIQTIAVAAAKDQRENEAHRLVCSGAVSLATARGWFKRTSP